MYRDTQSYSASIANRPGHIALVLVITISVLCNSIGYAQIPFSHQIQIPTGNLSAPSILVDGDPDTGIFGDGAGGLGFTANNILGMFLNGNGNVGIGTGNPSYKLDINGSIRMPNNTPLFLNNTSGIPKTTFFGSASDDTIIRSLGTSIKFQASNTEHLMTILENGNVGIGTASPLTRLDVYGTPYSNYMPIVAVFASSLFSVGRG